MELNFQNAPWKDECFVTSGKWRILPKTGTLGICILEAQLFKVKFVPWLKPTVKSESDYIFQNLRTTSTFQKGLKLHKLDLKIRMEDAALCKYLFLSATDINQYWELAISRKICVLCLNRHVWIDTFLKIHKCWLSNYKQTDKKS